jgi:hypothetical protein
MKSSNGKLKPLAEAPKMIVMASLKQLEHVYLSLVNLLPSRSYSEFSALMRRNVIIIDKRFDEMDAYS